MLRPLAEGAVEGLIDQSTQDLLLLGVNLFYMVGRHVEPIVRATRDRGVLAQVYMVDDESPVGKSFYGDGALRDLLRGSKAQTFARLEKTKADLEAISKALAEAGKSSRLEAWLYEYVSLYSVVAIDVGTDAGRLLVSPHTYMEEAKYPPVLELSRTDSPELYEAYWRDIEHFTRRVEKRPLLFV